MRCKKSKAKTINREMTTMEKTQQDAVLESAKDSGMIPVLDKGHVRLVDIMGDDSSVVQAARVSYGKGTKSTSEDQQLINRLMRNAHTSPFEMVVMKFHLKMPIFVERQWIRHRTASVNQYSNRYSQVIDETFVPPDNRICTQSATDKQGSGEVIIGRGADGFLNSTLAVQGIAAQAIKFGEQHNIAREINRINMTVAHYTHFYWQMNLHNLFHFLKLRLDPHAQAEIREYAEAIGEIVADKLPMCWSAFVEYNLMSVKFSLKEQMTLAHCDKSLKELHAQLMSEASLQKPGAYSNGEWSEFCKKIIQMIGNANESS